MHVIIEATSGQFVLLQVAHKMETGVFVAFEDSKLHRDNDTLTSIH